MRNHVPYKKNAFPSVPMNIDIYCATNALISELVINALTASLTKGSTTYGPMNLLFVLVGCDPNRHMRSVMFWHCIPVVFMQAALLILFVEERCKHGQCCKQQTAAATQDKRGFLFSRCFRVNICHI